MGQDEIKVAKDNLNQLRGYIANPDTRPSDKSLDEIVKEITQTKALIRKLLLGRKSVYEMEQDLI